MMCTYHNMEPYYDEVRQQLYVLVGVLFNYDTIYTIGDNYEKITQLVVVMKSLTHAARQVFRAYS